MQVGVDVSPEYFLSHPPDVMKVLFATTLGIFLGVEQEWSQKPAGLWTFTIITIVGTVLTITEESILLVLGAVLIIIQGAVFALRGLLLDGVNHLLTTAATMVLAYGVGVLVGKGYYQLDVNVAIVATLLLALRCELTGLRESCQRLKSRVRSSSAF